MGINIKRIKSACYMTNISMSVVANLSPILFITFRELYGISYSLLGLLVLINYFTQLAVDLIFSFFSHKFNLSLVVRITPILTFIGLLIYAVFPLVFPRTAYIFIIVGTFIFSASGGLAEVLMSPVIAALPSDNAEREMSKLHSIYAWGVVFVVIFSTLFLFIFDISNWHWLALLLSLIPLISSILFLKTDIPNIAMQRKSRESFDILKKRDLWVCVIAIFLGGASECMMSQWSSSYLEQALGIPKAIGDIFGVALLAFMLGLGRSLYAKFGNNITKILLFSSIGATVCYFTAAFANIAVIGLITCAITGLCTAMLWPGTLLVATERFSKSGVLIFALMAAGGDLGASLGSQLIGIVTDAAISNSDVINYAISLNITPEQMGMKLGMLAAMIFPLLSIAIYFYIVKNFKNKTKTEEQCHESNH